MIILLFGIVVFGAYACLVHVATSADRNAQSHTDLVPAAPAKGSTRTRYDLIDTNIEGSRWTVLDDRQLERLLKESAPTQGPDPIY